MFFIYYGEELKFKFDKSSLSEEIKKKQMIKGTYDSPCMSICNYNEQSMICGTCCLKKEEKRKWINSNDSEKYKIVELVNLRRSNQN